jgi:hypothetical protein
MERLRKALATKMFPLRPSRHSDTAADSREIDLDNQQAQEKAMWFSNLFAEVRALLACTGCRRNHCLVGAEKAAAEVMKGDQSPDELINLMLRTRAASRFTSLSTSSRLSPLRSSTPQGLTLLQRPSATCSCV